MGPPPAFIPIRPNNCHRMGNNCPASLLQEITIVALLAIVKETNDDYANYKYYIMMQSKEKF